MHLFIREITQTVNTILPEVGRFLYPDASVQQSLKDDGKKHKGNFIVLRQPVT